MIFRTRIYMFVLITALFLHAERLHAENQQLSEQQLKSAIVYNIARYVTWPASTMNNGQSFTVGIFGQGRSVSQWGGLQGKTVHGRKITVRRFTDIDELVNCQLVFIESSERKNVLRILAVLKDYSILTISEIEGFSHNGGMIALHLVNNRMTFEINLKSARTMGLDISSNLLKLATEVIK